MDLLFRNRQDSLVALVVPPRYQKLRGRSPIAQSDVACIGMIPVLGRCSPHSPHPEDQVKGFRQCIHPMVDTEVQGQVFGGLVRKVSARWILLPTRRKTLSRLSRPISVEACR